MSYAITAEEAIFTDAQWAERFDHELGGDPTTFGGSVLAVAYDRTGILELTDSQLARLLRDHGSTVADLQMESHPDLSLNHAGQALTFLGY
jgi:hypothetical protein